MSQMRRLTPERGIALLKVLGDFMEEVTPTLFGVFFLLSVLILLQTLVPVSGLL